MKIKASWERDIEADRLDSIKSVNYALGIEKGVVSDLQFNEELNKVQKKGSEIKERLEKEKIKEALCLAELSVKISTMKDGILQQPEGEPYEKENEYRRYSYDQIYGNGANPTENDLAAKMREYNNLIGKFCFSKRDLDKLITIISNIKENKVYDLTLNVAQELGF